MELKASLLCAKEEYSRKSTSGGAFYLIVKSFFELYPTGYVCGCWFDEEEKNAKHILINSLDEVYKVQGSKYVQSILGNVFIEIKELLVRGHAVLFSGTPCQVAAIKGYLGEKYSELYCVDIICHGVPSKKYLKKCIEYYEGKYNGMIKDFRFRKKSVCNRNGYLLSFKINGKKYSFLPEEDEYYNAFLQSYSLRPSCYECKFIGDSREGDISIGDSNNPDFHPCEAISLLIINSKKGQILAPDSADCEQLDIILEDEAKTNRQLIEPAKRPAERTFFYKKVYEHVYNSTLPKMRWKQKVYIKLLGVIPMKYKVYLKRKLKWVKKHGAI